MLKRFVIINVFAIDEKFVLVQERINTVGSLIANQHISVPLATFQQI